MLTWRTEQEHKLREATTAALGASAAALKVMTDEEVAWFIMHYERLTRHLLVEMPTRCHARLRLDASRRIVDYVSQPKTR